MRWPPPWRARHHDLITTDELQTKIRSNGITPRSGDVLLVRTGWLSRWREGTATVNRWAGLDPACAAWIDEQGFMLVGADNIAVEGGPSRDPNDAAPMHVELMRNRGVYFAELLDLEPLAAAGCTACLLIIAPLPIQGGAWAARSIPWRFSDGAPCARADPPRGVTRCKGADRPPNHNMARCLLRLVTGRGAV